MRLDHLLSKENRPRGWFYPVRLDSKLMMLFDFEGLEEGTSDEGKSGISETLIWGCSSAGRAPALHAGGQEFDPPHLHQRVRI